MGATDPERWKQIEKLCAAALDLPAGERAAFLTTACGDDAALLREVTSLLAADADSSAFLDQPVVPWDTARRDQILAPAEAAETVTSLGAGGGDEGADRMIGAYRLIRELGQGGLGTVYLAARADEQFKKRVALKLIRAGMATDSIRRRFLAERQILAGLEHPHIARLLDGGTEAGVPYFVMEYVEGMPIDEYCDRATLRVADRLKLFLAVCSAVSYAHQRLIVHRDIKPGNILVDRDGVPKLLDFGIAKLLTPELAFQTIDPTLMDMRVMTPKYASPEQVRGESITVASDVYSLGVLLYELLTGHSPYQFTRSTQQEVERVVCQEVPARPSTVITRAEDAAGGAGTGRATLASVSEARATQPDKLKRGLSGDLDNIVMMALRKEPERRYASVEQFAEDIRRHLDNRPVSARTDTFLYRTSKFVRRNKFAAAVAAIIAGFGVGMAVLAAQIATERDRATLESDKARQVTAFLVDLFAKADPGHARGNTLTVKEVLDKGAGTIAADLGGQPEVQATLMNTMGVVYRNLGLFEGAQPLLEGALETRRTNLGTDGAAYAANQADLGILQRFTGKHAEAEVNLQSALATQRRLLGNEHPVVAETLLQLGWLYREWSRQRDAEPLLRESVAIREKVLAPDDPALAISLERLGWLLAELNQPEEGERLLRRALAIQEKALGPDHYEVGVTLYHLAAWVPMLPADSLALLERALPIAERSLGKHLFVGMVLDVTADKLGQLGRSDEEEPLRLQVAQMLEEVNGPVHMHTGYFTGKLGNYYFRMGRYAEAETRFTKALTIFEQVLEPNHRYWAAPLGGLAGIEMNRGRYEQAAKLRKREAEIYEKAWGPTNRWRLTALVTLADVYGLQRKYAEAEALLNEVRELTEKARTPTDISHLYHLHSLAMVYLDQGRTREADLLFERVLALMDRQPGDSGPASHLIRELNGYHLAVRSMELYSRLMRRADRPAEAEKLEARARVLRALGRS